MDLGLTPAGRRTAARFCREFVGLPWDFLRLLVPRRAEALKRCFVVPKTVYFDASATTPRPRWGGDAAFFKASFGNAGSLHSKGFEASAALAGARSRVAAVLNCAPEEIVFTGSGTESVNLALKGVAEKHAGKGGCIITTSIEHHAVLDSCKWLASRGFDVTVVGVGREGIVSVDDVVAAIKPSTILVSVMYANNEVGALQPVREVAAACRANGVLFHTDACQAGTRRFSPFARTALI